MVDWPGAPDTANKPVLTNETSVNPSFVASTASGYSIRLVVNDGSQDSAPDLVTITATSTGACANPLILQTALPYPTDIFEVSTIIQIDASATDTVRVILATDADASLSASALQADPAGIATANFNSLSGWTIDSRSNNNPVSEGDSPSFILQRTASGIYYKIDVDFTVDDFYSLVQIDALSGCNCGNSAAACPP